MSARPARPAASHLHRLRFSRGSVLRLIKDIPADQLCAQPGPSHNHVMWIVGHIACTDDYFLNQFAGRDLALPESWHRMFAGGSTPTSDASRYPPWNEVKQAFRERREALTAWLTDMTESQLDEPTPTRWQPYALTMRDVAHFAAWHEGYHAGQISTLRPAFGLGPAFG